MKKLFLVLSVLLATFSCYTSGTAGRRTMPVNGDANGTAVFKASYDAWGKQTVTASTFRFHRGFTGHEHLPEFALINMNGRMYDPILGRFLSPDPYVQAPEFSQNFNRYSYCVNNPLIYTDPSGEIAWWVVPAVVGGIIGGVSNLVANRDNVDGFWDGVSTFGTGALAGAGTAVTGGSGAGILAVAGVSAGGGALVAANNDIVAQTGKNFNGFNSVDWTHVGKSSFTGGVSGFASGAAGYWAANSSMLLNDISSPVLRSAVVSPIAAGAGHVAGGTTAGLLQGQSFGEAFANSFDGIGKSMIVSGAIGVATTVGVSYAQGINPWTGNKIYPSNNGFKGQPTFIELQPGQIIDRYGNEIGRFFAPEGTPIGSRSLHPSTNTDLYNAFEIIKPFSVQSGIAVPFYGQPGGGVQYYSPLNTQQLINQGYIMRIKY